jgi:hypothetical protein
MQVRPRRDKVGYVFFGRFQVAAKIGQTTKLEYVGNDGFALRERTSTLVSFPKSADRKSPLTSCRRSSASSCGPPAETPHRPRPRAIRA